MCPPLSLPLSLSLSISQAFSSVDESFERALSRRLDFQKMLEILQLSVEGSARSLLRTSYWKYHWGWWGVSSGWSTGNVLSGDVDGMSWVCSVMEKVSPKPSCRWEPLWGYWSLEVPGVSARTGRPQGKRSELVIHLTEKISRRKKFGERIYTNHSRLPGEGNGNPLQCSCLENSMVRGAWQATFHGLTKSQKRLINYHSLIHSFKATVLLHGRSSLAILSFSSLIW